MDYSKLNKHIHTLACLPETGAPVISAYFDLTGNTPGILFTFRQWAAAVRRTFPQGAREAFDDAAAKIADHIPLLRGRGAAVFARAAEPPFFLPLSFALPLDPHFHAGGLPIIYPLVELKDRFNRFVIAIVDTSSARIIEVNLGDYSVELITDRPALRERVGREWSRQHYQNHARDRERRFLKEKIAVIESLMAKRGHNSLIIAGEPRHVTRLKEALPPHLAQRVVGEIRQGFNDHRLAEIVSHAIDSFTRAECEEAHDAVASLMLAVRAGGLATVGPESVARALSEHRVEKLFVSCDLDLADRELLVREATRQDIPIETVQHCELLDHNGGAGALLRFHASLTTQLVNA